jgi:hypothetical protein
MRTLRRDSFSTAIILAGVAAAPATAGGHAIPWHTMDGGGGRSAGGAYVVTGTAGQPDAGAHAGGAYMVDGGFWAFRAGAAPCPEDVDANGSVGFGDLVAVLAAWGPCRPDCPEDLDGDGAVGFGDLVAVLATWGPCA